MSPPLDARAKRSQQSLLRAGLELLNTNGEASLSDIANHAGVGRTTLYRQYETREKLISAIAIYCLETIEEASAPIESQAKSAMEAIRLLFEQLMPLTQEFQFLLNLEQLVENDPEVTAINKKQKQEMIELLEYGKTHGEFNSSLPNAWLLNLIESLFYIGWLQQKNEGASAQEAAKLAFVSFSNGASSH